MIIEIMKPQDAPVGLLDAKQCLKEIFPKKSRPSLRTFRRWQSAKYFPVVKLGRLTFFDPVAVKASLEKKFTIFEA